MWWSLWRSSTTRLNFNCYFCHHQFWATIQNVLNPTAFCDILSNTILSNAIISNMIYTEAFSPQLAPFNVQCQRIRHHEKDGSNSAWNSNRLRLCPCVQALRHARFQVGVVSNYHRIPHNPETLIRTNYFLGATFIPRSMACGNKNGQLTFPW